MGFYLWILIFLPVYGVAFANFTEESHEFNVTEEETFTILVNVSKTDQDVNLKYYYLRRNDDPNDKIIKLPKGTDEGDCILDSSLNQECPSHIFMRRNQDGLVNITMSNVLKKFVGEYRARFTIYVLEKPTYATPIGPSQVTSNSTPDAMTSLLHITTDRPAAGEKNHQTKAPWARSQGLGWHSFEILDNPLILDHCSDGLILSMKPEEG
ncbi:hypothetical protein OS493_019435 [Desmophyllum pertusum]|uniref:Uncharacterized protein n=1 Tax=Desmophyllum pertusum TaxID=174260 RepID=A0A9X0D8J9_9CNID|nr:hypothetical protein OS493_019435 [Desmophyllum pertusum]